MTDIISKNDIRKEIEKAYELSVEITAVDAFKLLKKVKELIYRSPNKFFKEEQFLADKLGEASVTGKYINRKLEDGSYMVIANPKHPYYFHDKRKTYRVYNEYVFTCYDEGLFFKKIVYMVFKL